MTRTWFSSGAAALVALMAVHSVTEAHADEVPRVAVVVSLSVNADAEQSTRLAQALAKALEQEFVIVASSGPTVDEKLADGVPDDCIANAECVRTLANKLDVQQLLLLTIVRVGERFKVSVTWGDGSDGRTVSRVTIDIDVEQQDPGPVFAVYATRLLPDAKPRPDEPAAGTGETPPNTDGQGSKQTSGQTSGQTSNQTSGQNSNTAGKNAGTSSVMPPVGLRTQDRHMTTGSWIAAGASATFLAAGLGFGLAARSAYGDLSEGQCADGACSEDDIDKLASRAATADVFLGAALVSGVAAGLLYWRSGGRISTGGTEVATFATGREFGVTIGGRF